MAMEKENHKEERPFAHYLARFGMLDPEEAARRLPQIRWDGQKFTLNLLHRTYEITHPEYGITNPEGGAVPSVTAQILILRYLLESRGTPWLGTWKTFREMPWGETYMKAFSGRALGRAAFAFGSRLEAFCRACEKMGAKPVGKSDAGFEFCFLDGYRMQLLLWAGDEEFPPNAQILYSDNFADGFTAEDRAVAADLLIGAIKANM